MTTKIHECSVYDISHDFGCNVVMKSFFQQLAREKCVISFNLVSDNALLPHYNMKRHSAPPVITGATSKLLSNDEAPSCPARRSSSQGFNEHSSGMMFLETIFDEVLETVLDEEDSILCEVDGCEEACSRPSSPASPLHHAFQDDSDFDSTFQRFNVDPKVDKSRESSTRSSPSLRGQMVAPKLPVRRVSMQRFSSSTSPIMSGCTTLESVASQAELSPSLPPPQSPDAQSWQQQGKVDHQECLAPPPTTVGYALDMKDKNDAFVLTAKESSNYGRRRLRRRSRLSSLDTGVTFRNSFSSQNNPRRG